MVVTPGQGVELATTLLAVPASDVDVVIVLGPRDVTDDIREGLNRLNLQRDTLAKRLGKTLLWCGLRTFLNATWEEAPDLWSIRDLTFRIPLLGVNDMQRASSTTMPGSSEVDRDETPRLIEAARKVGDDKNLGRLLLRHAQELLSRGEPRSAEARLAEGAAILRGLASLHGTYEEALCEELRGDVDVWLHSPREGVAAYGRALAMYQALERAADCGRIFLKRAEASDDVETSLQDLVRALVSFDQTGDRLGQANVLKARGDLRRFKADLDGALLDYERALELFLLADDRLGQANVLKARGDLRRFKADLDGALLDYERALELFLLVDDRLGQANVLRARGDLRRRKADLDGALLDYERALELFLLVDSRLGQANVLKARGDLRRRKADLDGALLDYERALELFLLVDDRLGQANVLKARGDLRRFKADLDSALLDYERALELFLLVDDRLGQANVLRARGDLRRFKADLDGALLDYERALELFLLVDSRLGQANVLQARGALEIARENPAAALPHYQTALALYEAIDDALGLSNVVAELARTHALLGQPTEARVAAARAIPLAKRAQNRYALALINSVLSALPSPPDAP
ncbi:tetratricopeptide repeat protein [Sorangium sp. So ce1000]|uniref:tetratricopeptide repeat protein n=1 Tax=Sorangium sp. So ce1000 TaxID=3133325 RepID=UPI003F63299F